jgi:septal ring factor EnvC (AmiA/AmiB activator)
MSEDTIGTGRCKTNKHAFDFNCLVCLQTLARESIEQDSRLRVKLAELERELEHANEDKLIRSTMLADFSAEIRTLRAERDSLASELDSVRQGKAATQDAVFALQTERNELATNLAAAREALEWMAATPALPVEYANRARDTLKRIAEPSGEGEK